LGLSGELDRLASLEALFAAAFERIWFTDGLIAQSSSQSEISGVREMMPTPTARSGRISSHDISVPWGAAEFIILGGGKKYGHLGNFRIKLVSVMWATATCTIMYFPVAGRSRRTIWTTVGGDQRRADHHLVHEMGRALSVRNTASGAKVKKDLEKRYSDPRSCRALARDQAA